MGFGKCPASKGPPICLGTFSYKGCVVVLHSLDLTFLQLLALKKKKKKLKIKKKKKNLCLLHCEREPVGWNTLQRAKPCFKSWAPICDIHSNSTTLKICFWDAWVDLYPRNENHFVICAFGPFCPCFICNLLKKVMGEKLIERLFSTISVGNITTIEKPRNQRMTEVNLWFSHCGDSHLRSVWVQSLNIQTHTNLRCFFFSTCNPVCNHCSFQLPCRGFLQATVWFYLRNSCLCWGMSLETSRILKIASIM